MYGASAPAIRGRGSVQLRPRSVAAKVRRRPSMGNTADLSARENEGVQRLSASESVPLFLDGAYRFSLRRAPIADERSQPVNLCAQAEEAQPFGSRVGLHVRHGRF